MKKRDDHLPAPEGSSREERAESHRKEMEEQARGQGDWDRTVDPTVTKPPRNPGSRAQD
jgi:hypothetical protein